MLRSLHMQQVISISSPLSRRAGYLYIELSMVVVDRLRDIELQHSSEYIRLLKFYFFFSKKKKVP